MGLQTKYRRVAVLNRHDFFGEMALLNPDHERAATIRTTTFCELRCLSAEAFNVITNR